MFKIFYILGLKYEIYKTKKDNAFAKTVADGFRNASEKKLAEVKPLYEQVDEMKKIDSHKREDRDKVKDLKKWSTLPILFIVQSQDMRTKSKAGKLKSNLH